MLNFMLTPLCCTLRNSNTSLPNCQVLWPKMGTMAWIAKQSQKSYKCTKKFHTLALLHSPEARQYRMAYFVSLYSFTYAKIGQLHGKWLHRIVPDLYLLHQTFPEFVWEIFTWHWSKLCAVTVLRLKIRTTKMSRNFLWYFHVLL